MAVAAGSHSGAIDCDGLLYIWGTGVFGTFLSPLKISNYAESGMIETISINNGFGLAKNKEGKAFAWGINSDGQLGSGDTAERSFMTSIEAITLIGQCS